MRRSTQFNSPDKKEFPEIRVPVLVSACLLGICCRYNGAHSLCPALVDFLPGIHGVPVCPEQLGGLPTPRPAANIIGGDGKDVLNGQARLLNRSNQDVTGAFLKGAEETYKIAQITGANLFITKKKSPSCGLTTPYCDKPEKNGMGVTAAFLLEKGLAIWELDQDDPFPDTKFLEMLKKHK